MHATPSHHPRSLRLGLLPIAAVAILAAVASGCSSNNNSTAAPGSTGRSTGATAAGSSGSTMTTVSRPAGASAQLSEITGSSKAFMGEAVPPDLPGAVEREFVATGTATTYKAPGGMPGSGTWTFEPGTSAPYRTRVLVRRPAEMDRFSGTVVVEWLNVSGGVDANPDYTSLAAEVIRKGHAWVGVSAQYIGIEGGPVLVRAPGAEEFVGKGIKVLDPDRYGSLEHPGDGYSFDIYTQVGRALRDGGPALDGVKPTVLLAAGESQSAVALTTYYNGVQPLTLAYDGFLVHSRAFAGLPLVDGKYADLAGAMTGTVEPILLRSDLEAPVLELQAEGDVIGILNSVAVRQPDTDRFRLWEVAGTAHADRHLLSNVIADQLDCGAPINNAPMHLVAKAALRSLDAWVRTSQAPPIAPRLEVTDAAKPEARRNPDGIVIGGIRTPVVDVPVDILTGSPPPKPELICILMGSTQPLSPQRLAALYPNRADYEQRYRVAADAAVTAGFVLADDRDALLAYAQPDRISG